MMIQVNILTVICFAIVIVYLILQVSYLNYRINNLYKDMKALCDVNSAFTNRFKEHVEIYNKTTEATTENIKNIVEAINHHTNGINAITSRLNKMQGIDIN